MRTSLALGLIAVLLLSGCGSSTDATTAVPSSPTASGAQRSVCTVYSPGGTTLMQIRSRRYDVARLCRGWLQARAAQGELWSDRAPAHASADRIDACDLSDPRRNITVKVRDDGRGASGSQTCARVVAMGAIRLGPASP